MFTVPLQQYTGTVAKGFEIEALSGAIIIGRVVKYEARNGRDIPIANSLPGYGFELYRDGKLIAEVLEYRESDRFTPMQIKPAGDDEKVVLLSDIAALRVDASTMRSELAERPLPGEFIEMTPPMLCLILWECKKVAIEVIRDVRDGILAYRTPKTQIGQWKNLKAPSGYLPYSREAVDRVIEIEIAEGVRVADIVFANIWGGAPDYLRSSAA